MSRDSTDVERPGATGTIEGSHVALVSLGLLLVPPVRALLRRVVAGYLAKRVRVVDVGGGASGSAAGGRARPAPSGEPVIDAEFTVQRSPPKVGDGDGEGVGDSGATGS